MNLKLFNEFMKKENRPSQCESEWQKFLEICETYLEKHKIENPIAVELGTWKNRQKKFYEKLLGVKHIGINISQKRGQPDIIGNTHDPKTMAKLKEMLNGHSINILFIDASHAYEDVKKDYELYSPLCPDIIAFHDIETYRYKNIQRCEVWKFWDELKEDAHRGRKHKDFLFLSIYQYRNKVEMGIGVIIKR